MKHFQLSLTFCCLLVAAGAVAQTNTSDTVNNPKEMEVTGRSYMLKGDYANAVIVLNRGLALRPGDLELTKDLALTYYLQKDNSTALKTILPLLDREDADDQVFQITGDIYQAMNMNKECEKLYKKGLKKFPADGALWNELGELLWNEQDDHSVASWETGIKVDPNYAKNYYNVCRFYFLSGDYVWAILYGETYINIDPLGSNTPEIKKTLLDAYKKLFALPDLTKNNKSNKPFVAAFLTLMNKQSSAASRGLNPETLTMIRTKFILDWFKEYNDQYPFRLFEYQRQLLQQGMFDAYNQWLFGPAQDLAAYQNWINTHSSEYEAFNNFRKGRIFKLPPKQYYK